MHILFSVFMRLLCVPWSFFFYFLKRQRGHEVVWVRSWGDLGAVVEGKSKIKIYCMKIKSIKKRVGSKDSLRYLHTCIQSTVVHGSQSVQGHRLLAGQCMDG